MYRDIPKELLGLIEPIVEDHGLELVDADVVRGRGTGQLRVVVDTPAGDGLVSVEACAAVSRELGSQLDAEDAIHDSYVLEVSSPGLDRPLSREKDFRAACGSDVKLETRVPLGGRRRFKGKLTAFDGETARLEIDGDAHDIPFAQVAKAHVIYHFSAADFNARREG